MIRTPIRAVCFALPLMLLACDEGGPMSQEATTPPQGSDPVDATSAADDPIPSVDVAPDPTTEEKEAQPMHGFSFVRDDLAGMPYPYGDDLAWVADQGVHLVVSLTEAPVDVEAVEALGMEHLHLPIEDFHPPTPEQQQDFVRELQARADAGQTVAVHCLAGLGRTGTMLATWFVAQGATAEEAIEEVRTLRPGSIETAEQEEAVRRFARAMEAR